MNKNLYSDELGNAVRISAFEKYEGPSTFSQIAAKYVAGGKETYIINGQRFAVTQGEYIIGNNDALSDVYINEKTTGLCIDISTRIIQEIANDYYENHDFLEFLSTDKFFVNKYKSGNTTLGLKLHQLFSHLESNNHQESILTNEFFYSIGESVIKDQAIIFSQYTKLRYKKQIVNETHFRRLLEVKQYLDECYLNEISIATLSQMCCLSKFAFLRQFKLVYGMSPYQYLMRNRLNYAAALLQNNMAVSDVAHLTCFADTPTFSKAFKRQFGTAPKNRKKHFLTT